MIDMELEETEDWNEDGEIPQSEDEVTVQIEEWNEDDEMLQSKGEDAVQSKKIEEISEDKETEKWNEDIESKNIEQEDENADRSLFRKYVDSIHPPTCYPIQHKADKIENEEERRETGRIEMEKEEAKNEDGEILQSEDEGTSTNRGRELR